MTVAITEPNVNLTEMKVDYRLGEESDTCGTMNETTTPEQNEKKQEEEKGFSDMRRRRRCRKPLDDGLQRIHRRNSGLDGCSLFYAKVG